MPDRNFFAELRRRNVYKVAVAYAVVAWLIVQIATQVFPFFDIPNWSVRLVILLLVLDWWSRDYSGAARVAETDRGANWGDNNNVTPPRRLCFALAYQAEVLREALALPSGGVAISPALLKLDPVWDPLRRNPGFLKLIADREAAQTREQTKP